MNINANGIMPTENLAHVFQERQIPRGSSSPPEKETRYPLTRTSRNHTGHFTTSCHFAQDFVGNCLKASGVPPEEGNNEHSQQAPGGPSISNSSSRRSKTPCPARRTLRFLIETVKRIGHDRSPDDEL
jgi:hypothetical protein